MSHDNQVTEEIILAVIKVHQTLGPGFLESIYQNALTLELRQQGLTVESEKEVVVYYNSKPVGKHRIDLLVAGRVIVELKTVEDLASIHYAQLRSYLKASGLRLGLLVNFARERADYRRVELSPN